LIEYNLIRDYAKPLELARENCASYDLEDEKKTRECSGLFYGSYGPMDPLWRAEGA
jgi:hypothetical protein